MTRRRPRVLFLPVDGRGLGHLSRACKLARALEGRADCLIVTGTPYARRLLPEGCGLVRVPGLADAPLGAEPASQPLIAQPPPEAIPVRRARVRAAVRAFAPDVIVTDLFPTGLGGELGAVLAESRAVKLIVFRPVPGDSGRRAVLGDLGLDALGRFYDAFLVASDRRTALVDEDLGFSGRETGKRHHLGYVSLPVTRAEIEGARRRRGLGPGDRWVVCSAGSGFYARELVGDCLRLTRDFPEARFDLVSGPSGPPVAGAPDPVPPRKGRVAVVPERADLRVAHAAADVVICHGGYNTLTEALEGGAAVIVDPRGDVHHERARHVARLQPHVPIALAEGRAALGRRLEEALRGGAGRRPIRDTGTLDFDGCRAFVRLVWDRLGLAPAARRRAWAR